jgi:tetratricopeptide (TPR) repeat protein
MAKGIEFEAKALEYLKNLFEKLGFHVTEARQQKSGTQDGFDIRISFLDNRKRERQFYFECKNYDTSISWDAIGVKIFELYCSNHRPDGYIAISPHVDFSNKHIDLIAKMAETISAPIKWWTPETNVKSYFSINATFYEYVYKAKPEILRSELYLEEIKLRYFFEEILRQKDKISGSTYTNLLTLKIPTLNADDIIGRENELKDLHFLLFGHKKQVVVVNGLGGIGKTSLVQAYISKYMGDYRNVAWITQTTNDVVSEIANAEGLAQKLTVSKEGKDAQQIFYEIITALKEMANGPNLLIIDNVDDSLGKWREYLPSQPHWHVLTTSRSKIDGFYPMELDFLSHAEAIALFKKHCSIITSEQEISDLVKTVDYHTLTIEILAKTANRHRTDIATLKKAIKDDLNANVYIRHKGAEKIDKVRSYLCSIFNLSGLNDNETWLMKQFICLPAEYHSYGRLLELIDPDQNKKARFPELCSSLTEQGWLLYNKEMDAYKMHLVVQEVANQQLRLSLTDIDRLLNKTTLNLKTDETRDNPVDKFQWIPFGYTLLNNFQNETTPSIGALQNNLALVLQYLGEYEQAWKLLQKTVMSYEKNFGIDHPATAMSYSNLALVLQDLGEYERARELLQKVIINDEKNLSPDDPIVAMRYWNLATILIDLGKYEQARELLQKVMISDEKNFGPDHPITAIRYSILAAVLQNLGQFEQARKLLQKAMISDEKNFGLDHPTTALRYSNLATVLQNLGEFEQARELQQKAMVSDEKNFGPYHPSTARNYSNLAVILQSLGEYEKAKGLLQKAIISDEKNFGTDHPTTAVTYSNMAVVLQACNQIDEACKLVEKALLIFKKRLPEGHHYIFGTNDFLESIKNVMPR